MTPRTADQEHAIYKAGQGEARTSWQFVTTERHNGTTCPIDTREPGPNAVAAESGYHWAYIVYAAGRTR